MHFANSDDHDPRSASFKKWYSSSPIIQHVAVLDAKYNSVFTDSNRPKGNQKVMNAFLNMDVGDIDYEKMVSDNVKYYTEKDVTEVMEDRIFKYSDELVEIFNIEDQKGTISDICPGAYKDMTLFREVEHFIPVSYSGKQSDLSGTDVTTAFGDYLDLYRYVKEVKPSLLPLLLFTITNEEWLKKIRSSKLDPDDIVFLRKTAPSVNKKYPEKNFYDTKDDKVDSMLYSTEVETDEELTPAHIYALVKCHRMKKINVKKALKHYRLYKNEKERMKNSSDIVSRIVFSVCGDEKIPYTYVQIIEFLLQLKNNCIFNHTVKMIEYYGIRFASLYEMYAKVAIADFLLEAMINRHE